MKQVESRIRELRIQKGLTQRKLAQAAGVTHQMISLAETSGIVDLSAAKQYADILDCKPEELLRPRRYQKKRWPDTPLGRKLRERNQSQIEFAMQANLCISSVHAACRGIMTSRTAKRYAAVLGCDWKELLD